jgi:hypothetical protein
MSYRIIPSEDHQYIIHKAVGSINRHIMFEQTLEAHALGKKLGINRFLVDLTEARNEDYLANDYFFAHEDMKKNKGINKSAIAALIISPEDRSHDFIEIVLRNAGLSARLFTDPDAAMNYLFAKEYSLNQAP